MRVHTRGIVSYAGLDKAALWKQAKRSFAQTDDPIPPRFAAFLPLFPVELIQSMRYVGVNELGRAMVSKNGFSIDPSEYHRLLYEQMPELYTGDNFARNFDNEGRFVGRSVFSVDTVWATVFPQYQPFMGERLVIYAIAGGPQAVAVPESVFPKGCGVLCNAEIDMHIAARCEHYTAYVRERVAQGDVYDAVRFENDYMERFELTPVTIRQSEVGRMMQDLSIVKSLQGEPAAPGLYTENAKRAEHILQYTPGHTACDTFESLPTSRGTARLIQLYFDHDDFISDLWLPYTDVSEYIDKQTMLLDVKALCEGFQIPPAYDPNTLGGRYPNCVRVAVVRDRKLRPLVAETLNNPAYGSGMNPLGMMNKLVFLEDSKELLRLNKLSREQVDIRCCNLEVSPEDYRRMLERAAAQERKGGLIDAMYRRESALKQLQPNTRAYDRAGEQLTRRVETAERLVQSETSQPSHVQLSGYDADIEYLRRMEQSREADGEQPAAFAADTLRDMSVESGYAMRGSIGRFRYEELLLPGEPEDVEIFEADSPDEGAEGNSPEADSPDEGTEVGSPEADSPDEGAEVGSPEADSAAEAECQEEARNGTEALKADRVEAEAERADSTEREASDELAAEEAESLNDEAAAMGEDAPGDTQALKEADVGEETDIASTAENAMGKSDIKGSADALDGDLYGDGALKEEIGTNDAGISAAENNREYSQLDNEADGSNAAECNGVDDSEYAGGAEEHVKQGAAFFPAVSDEAGGEEADGNADEAHASDIQPIGTADEAHASDMQPIGTTPQSTAELASQAIPMTRLLGRTAPGELDRKTGKMAQLLDQLKHKSKP